MRPYQSPNIYDISFSSANKKIQNGWHFLICEIFADDICFVAAKTSDNQALSIFDAESIMISLKNLEMPLSEFLNIQHLKIKHTFTQNSDKDYLDFMQEQKIQSIRYHCIACNEKPVIQDILDIPNGMYMFMWETE